MSRIASYLLGVAVAALAVTLWLFRLAPEVEPRLLAAAVCFSTLSIFAHSLNYQLARGASGSIGFIPFLAAVVLAPHWVTVATIATAVLAVEILVRRPLLKALFNISQHALAIGAAIVSYDALGGHSLLATRQLTLADLPAFASVFLVFFAINSLGVSGAIALSEQKSVWQVWRQNTLRTLAYDIFSIPVVYIFAMVYVHWGPLGAIVLSLPILGVRQLYKTNWQLEKVNHELLQLMVAAIEARDPYTSGHSKRVAHYARIIARITGLSRREVERVGVAALLHDVGKIHEVYAAILGKPDKLTTEERLVMETHPIKSAELVENVSHLRDLVAPIRHHHENWDGTGYPDSLAAESIPLAARIIMIADTMDAMTTDRPYRKALGPDEVRAELIKLRGRQFDPKLVASLVGSPDFLQLFVPSLPTPRSTRSVVSIRRKAIGI